MLMAPMIPVLVPTGVQEYLDLGVHGFAMSRYSGLVARVQGARRYGRVLGVGERRPGAHQRAHTRGLHAATGRVGTAPAGSAAVDGAAHPRATTARRARLCAREPVELRRLRQPRARGSASSPAGKSYLDVRQALEHLGIDEQEAARIGIRVYKLGLTWPLEPQGLHAFALDWKRSSSSRKSARSSKTRIRALLYHWPDARRPRIVGKRDEESGPNEWLLPPNGELSAEQVALVIAARLKRFHTSDASTSARRGSARRRRRSPSRRCRRSCAAT
jgi:indolepyruvate ferredoxin oxidoreductase